MNLKERTPVPAIRPITIRSVMNGYIVEVGCQTLVFDSLSSLVTELHQYLADPNGVERRFVERFGMSGPAVPPGATETAAAPNLLAADERIRPSGIENRLRRAEVNQAAETDRPFLGGGYRV